MDRFGTNGHYAGLHFNKDLRQRCKLRTTCRAVGNKQRCASGIDLGQLCIENFEQVLGICVRSLEQGMASEKGLQ